MTWDEWFATLKLKHFTADELSRFWDRPNGVATPPRSLWGNVIPTMLLLDHLRSQVRSPIRINSGYRDPFYNQKVRGAALSQHMDFSAVDFTCDDVSPAEIGQMLIGMNGITLRSPVLIPYRTTCDPDIPTREIEIWDRRDDPSDSVFSWVGGIGIYGTFTHVDSRGYHVVWVG